MDKSLYATVSVIRLNFYGPNKKEHPGVLFHIDTYGLISSSNLTFNLKISRKFFEKYLIDPRARFNFDINDEIRKEVLDEINANLYPKSKIHVVFSGLKSSGMIEFMNEIGDHGWDTSGQLPSTHDGPTYVTMMRKRIS